MPYTLKTQQISVKDPDSGEYIGVDVLTEQTKEGLIADLQAEGDTQITRINQAAIDVQSAVDQAETEAQQLISSTQSSLNTLETQKDTIAQTIASMAELGTDTTLTTAGMAADAKATGDEISNVKNAIGELVLVQDTQPSSPDNRIWVDPDDNEVEIPTMDEFTTLSSAITYTAQALYAYKSEPFPASIDSNGAIVSVQSQSTDRVMYFAVKPNSVISTTGTISVYAFYTTEPIIGAVSYNGSRANGGLTNVNVPDGCNWLAIRTSAANVSSVDLNPKSAIISDINRLNSFNTQYSFTVFAHNHILGKYYATNGSVGTNAAYNYYEKIPVIKGNTYLFTNKGARYCVLYNNNTIVQTAEDVSVFTANYDGDLYVTEYVADPLSMYIYNDFYKITEWTNAAVNGYVLDIDRYTSKTFNYPTTAGDLIHLKLKGYTGSNFINCILYSVEDGNNVIRASLYSDTGEYIFVAPTATRYTIYVNRSQTETATLAYELTNLSKSTLFNTLDKIDILNRLAPQIYNKKIACLGDSFTYGVDTYVAKLSKRYLSHAINYGVASSRIVLDTTSGGTTIESFLNRYSEMDNDADIVVVFGGINDAYDLGAGTLSLGTIDSALDSTTFYGGLKLLVTNLMKKYPDKQIIGVIPPDCQSGAYYIDNMPDVQQAEREVYNMYGVPFVDIKRECYKMSTLSEMVAIYREAADNIHPSNAGQEALCDTIAAGIRRIIP